MRFDARVAARLPCGEHMTFGISGTTPAGFDEPQVADVSLQVTR